MRAASTFVQSFEDGEDRISKAMGGQVSKTILDAIRQRTMAKNELAANPLLGITDEGFEAQADFRQLLTRWIISNPEATQLEIDEQAGKIGKSITDRFEYPDLGGDEPATYNRDPALPFDNPYSTPAPAEQEGGDPEVRAWEKAQGVTPEYRARIEEQAKQKGMGYDEYIRSRVSKGTFALALSQEFASLPDPTTGRSFYHGDNLNRSRVPRSAVYRALGFAAQPATYSPNPAAHGLARLVRPDPTFPQGTGGNLNFVHKGQETISPTLRTTLTAASQQLGRDLTISSGYRSGNHPVERRKRAGGGEHTRGNAADISMAGMNDSQRADLVRALMAQGVTRFITYTGSPDMLHVDLKRQRGSNGLPYFMHDKSARNIQRAPAWLRAIAEESTSI
ncbi:hypothetical protein G6L67_11805 [Agrobacterium tumefaciens]|nr:D-Ala-D-Ala carboxypeptidase family metallohydrolase [Agrobacterium tumefaciens]AYM81858.1 hypothetical protein At12D1_19710 [Agrobacterium tumefaciens]NTE92535.1 hypothetical protein [Agrobacterium tumefaciens]